MQAVIFGWKRDNLEDYLLDCEKIAKELTLNKFKIYTGAGGGFMRAANKGCFSINNDNSFGVSVKSLYDKEGQSNNYYKKDNLQILDTFSERKNKLIENMDLYIFFPGGVGTLDEFTELMNLFKTGHIEKKPVILYGYKYWTSLKSWFEFNKISFPEMYVDAIIDSFTEFNTTYNKIFNNEMIIKKDISSDEDIKIFTPLVNNNKSNMFIDNTGINDLIDELFNDPIFKKEITNISNNLLEPLIKEDDNKIDSLIDKDDSTDNYDDILDFLNNDNYDKLNSSEENDSSEIEFIEIIIEDDYEEDEYEEDEYEEDEYEDVNDDVYKKKFFSSDDKDTSSGEEN